MINYVIATYSGIYRETENKEYALQTQLESLYKILCEKKAKNVPSIISQITIVCPTPRHPIYNNYYQKDRWLETFTAEFPNIRLVFMDYIGENKDHSYDQWIQGYMVCPECKYHIFIEDDYYVRGINFDQTLVDLYLEKFPTNIGYLATKASTNNNHSYHASVSNGIVSKDTMKLFENPLTTYYGMASIDPYPQLKFSYMFTHNNIPILDISDKYRVLFWNSVTNTIVDFTNSDATEIIFAPVQINSDLH